VWTLGHFDLTVAQMWNRLEIGWKIALCNHTRFATFLCIVQTTLQYNWGRRGRDRMVVGFTTSYAISARFCFKHILLISARCTTLYDKVCQWLAAGLWFSSGPPVSSINETDYHDIAEILLKVVLNNIQKVFAQKVC
jgi:hypothetical protein